MTRRCPICERESQDAYAPFCSKRCADLDLQRWFTEAYRVPGEGAPEDGLEGRPEAEDDQDD